MPYVKSLAKKFSFYKNKDDLYQAGYMGLIMAYQNFDPSFNVKFSTYAYSYILGEMKKIINDNNLKYSKELLSLKNKIDKVSILLTQKLMRIPTKKEIIEFLNITDYEYEEVMQMENTVSLDSIVGEDLQLYEVISDKNIDYSSLVALKEELRKLTKEEKELINSRYIYGFAQREIADNLKTNQVDISRKEKKILQKLKVNLKS